MKLKEHIEGFDIDNIEDIQETVHALNNHCKNLEAYGEYIKTKLKLSNDEFTSTNYSRIEEIINHYLTKLNIFKSEMEELNASVEAYIEKIGDITNPNVWNF